MLWVFSISLWGLKTAGVVMGSLWGAVVLFVGRNKREGQGGRRGAEALAVSGCEKVWKPRKLVWWQGGDDEVVGRRGGGRSRH